MPNMKIYMSLAFEENKKRIEPNDPGDYEVHLEDYESINDLIARSIRTKTKFTPQRDENAVYDDVLVDVADEFEKLIEKDQSETAAKETDTPGQNAERSEADDPLVSDDAAGLPMQ